MKPFLVVLFLLHKPTHGQTTHWLMDQPIGSTAWSFQLQSTLCDRAVKVPRENRQAEIIRLLIAFVLRLRSRWPAFTLVS